MTMPLDVLVMGGDEIATTQAQAQLEARGHVVHRCHAPGTPAFPCIGMADASACPLETGIDVALLVRRGVHPRPAVEEDGARCAIRAGVPLVEDGPDLLDPFEPWVTERVSAEGDLAAVCALAADRRFAHLRMLIRDRIAKLAATAGTTSIDAACLFRSSGRDLVIDLHLPVPLDKATQQALGVRVLDAVHASGRTYGQVDVNVHGHAA
jgi:hypothetical protein